MRKLAMYLAGASAAVLVVMAVLSFGVGFLAGFTLAIAWLRTQPDSEVSRPA